MGRGMRDLLSREWGGDCGTSRTATLDQTNEPVPSILRTYRSDNERQISGGDPKGSSVTPPIA